MKFGYDSNWNFQKDKDLYHYASSDWDYHKYIVLMKDGSVHKFSSICDEGYNGIASCYVEALTKDDELDDYEWEFEDILMWSDVTGVL